MNHFDGTLCDSLACGIWVILRRLLSLACQFSISVLNDQADQVLGYPGHFGGN